VPGVWGDGRFNQAKHLDWAVKGFPYKVRLYVNNVSTFQIDDVTASISPMSDLNFLKISFLDFVFFF